MKRGAATFLGLLLLPGVLAASEPEPESSVAVREILASMEAVTGLDYEGVFVLHDGEALESYRVIQRIDDGVAHEKIVSLSGPYREFHRRDEQVICLLPEHELQLTGISRAMSPLPGPFPHAPDYYDRLEKHYRLSLLGEGRVAGRRCDRVGILPRDNYRYAEELCIDREHGILLSSRKFHEDESGRTELKSAQFVRIEFPDRIDASRLEAGIDTEGFRTRERGWQMVEETPAAATWQVNEPPPGFVLVGRSQRTQDESPRVLEHLIYSDGLSNVSVFVGEHSGGEDIFTGHSRQRAINVLGAVRGDYHVTAVGEVPERTLEHMVEHIKQVDTAR